MVDLQVELLQQHIAHQGVIHTFRDPHQVELGQAVFRRHHHGQAHGLKPGDQWCLCALRWQEAFEAGVAPPAVLQATHERALDIVTLEQLRSRAYAH